MKINNGFNILPWHDSLEKQNCKKWYAYGQAWPLLCPQGFILPFQFISDTAITISSNIYAISVETGQAIDLGVKPTVTEIRRADITYYIVKLVSTSIVNLPIGRYNLRMNTSEGFLYSEELVVINNANECIKVEYWNEDTLKFTSGEINFTDDFHFIFYINSTIGKPEYEFEEELTKRLGYKFIESQTSNKVYKFSFVAPEYICDAMRLIRMCDYIKLTTKFDSYNALSFAYEPKWQEQGDLAAVDVEFDTDCIIQKLESFNRRAKESFYNALLADIDEPVLFSTDTVAQYYTEYTTTGTISGKLIRQLTAISEDELVSSLSSIVLPVDNQSDNSQVAKKAFLSDIVNKLIPKVNLSDYLLKSVWDKVFEIRTDRQGKEYIFGKLPVVTQYGITMYADGGDINLPSLYAGLPIDGKTLIRDEKGVLMVNPDIELGGGVSNFWDLSGIPSWITNSKPKYSYSEIEGAPDLGNYALKSDLTLMSEKLNDFLEGSDTDTIINKWKELEVFLNGLSESDNLAAILSSKVGKDYVDGNFVTLGTTQPILGEKDFTGGLKVNGSPIYYDTEKKYWKFEGDLLVTGGVTMYGNDSEFIPSTIMDAIQTDGVTIRVNPITKNLEVIGNTSTATTLGQLQNVGTWADSVADVDRIMYQAAGSSSWVAKSLSSIGGGVSGDYLPLSGGTINGALAVQNSNAVIELRNSDASNRGFFFYKGGSEWRISDNGWYHDYILLHSGNYSSYALPLSGGKISGTNTNVLDIDSTNVNEVGIRFMMSSVGKSWVGYSLSLGAYLYNNSSASYLSVKDDGSLLYSKGTIWHSGNDGSGSGLDADLLDGLESGYFLHYAGFWNNANSASGRDALSVTYWADGHTGYLSTYGTSLNFHGGDGMWHNSFACRTDGYIDFYQGINTTTMTHRGTLAYTWSNVASATKLQTARTIWGQSFDGTGNVNGHLQFNGNYSILNANGAQQVSFNNSFLVLGYDNCVNKKPTYLDGYNIYLRSGSNWTETIYIGSDNKVKIIAGAISGGNVWASDSGQLVIRQGTYGSNLYSLGLTSNTDGYCEIQSASAGVGAIPLVLQKLGGNVGIGTTSPAYKLDVNGVIKGYDFVGSHWRLASGAAGMWIQAATNDNSSANGVIFISGMSAAWLNKCEIVGELLVRGGITMYSDQRKKTILSHVELSLKQIAEAPLIEHYYNSDDKKTTHVGSIAQYWASMNDWFCKLDSEGYYTMEIQNCALASAISIARELDRYESKTDRTINKLKKKIALLEEEVEQLRSRL